MKDGSQSHAEAEPAVELVFILLTGITEIHTGRHSKLPCCPLEIVPKVADVFRFYPR